MPLWASLCACGACACVCVSLCLCAGGAAVGGSAVLLMLLLVMLASPSCCLAALGAGAAAAAPFVRCPCVRPSVVPTANCQLGSVHKAHAHLVSVEPQPGTAPVVSVIPRRPKQQQLLPNPCDADGRSRLRLTLGRRQPIDCPASERAQGDARQEKRTTTRRRRRADAHAPPRRWQPRLISVQVSSEPGSPVAASALDFGQLPH